MNIISRYLRPFLSSVILSFTLTGVNLFAQDYEISYNLAGQFNFKGARITGLTYDGEHLWYSDIASDSLIAIDTGTGQQIGGHPFPVEVDLYGLTFDGNDLWASSGLLLYKIDYTTGYLLHSFQLPYATEPGATVTGLSWKDNKLYCAAPRFFNYVV